MQESSVVPSMKWSSEVGQYLRLSLYCHGLILPVCRIDTYVFSRSWLPPKFGIPLLFWKRSDNLADDYEVWTPRRSRAGVSRNQWKATLDYAGDMIDILKTGWSAFRIGISNPLTFTSWRLERCGRVSFGGIKKSEFSISDSRNAIAKILDRTNEYCAMFETAP